MADKSRCSKRQVSKPAPLAGTVVTVRLPFRHADRQHIKGVASQHTASKPPVASAGFWPIRDAWSLVVTPPVAVRLAIYGLLGLDVELHPAPRRRRPIELGPKDVSDASRTHRPCAASLARDLSELRRRTPYFSKPANIEGRLLAGVVPRDYRMPASACIEPESRRWLFPAPHWSGCSAIAVRLARKRRLYTSRAHADPPRLFAYLAASTDALVQT